MREPPQDDNGVGPIHTRVAEHHDGSVRTLSLVKEAQCFAHGLEQVGRQFS